jgi:hypothetical protein
VNGHLEGPSHEARPWILSRLAACLTLATLGLAACSDDTGRTSRQAGTPQELATTGSVELQPCSATTALAAVDDACGLCPEVTFVCPDAGQYSVFTGSYTAGNPFTCEAVASP